MKPALIALAVAASTVLGCTVPRLKTPPPVAVTIVVDYGTPERPVLTAQTLVPAGASPIEALLDVAQVDQRYVSRTAEDVWSVDGVATNVEASMYWAWRLNGRQPREAPDRYTLKNGDLITWTYVQGQRPDYH